MVRIGGKGMSYIVRNCPAILRMTKICDAYEKTRDLPQLCEYCTDCVVKRVIDKCKYYQNKIGRTPQYRAGYVDATKDILELFELERIN